MAGSGKSLILAHRAAHIASLGKKVLFLTYNITLIGYIQYLLRRMPYRFNYSDIVITNYHHFCSVYFRENEINWPKGSSTRDVLDNSVPSVLGEFLEKKVNRRNRKYDAIIIDEVQDFDINWLDSVHSLLSSNDEILIAGDDNQDIYGRGTEKLEQFKKGFSGQWGNIKFCYRLSPKLVQEANRFAKIFIVNGNQIESYKSDELFDPILMWYDLKDNDNGVNEIKKVYDVMYAKNIFSGDNTIILVPDHSIGKQLSNLFEKSKIEVLEIFNDRNKKINFKYDSKKLKICTLQSFKGWEYDNILLYTPNEKYNRTYDLNKLIYTAITRAKKNLIVLNNNSTYFGFGESVNWEK